MPLHVDTTTLAIGGSIILAVGFYIWSNIRRVWSLSLPPGPRGLPFLGNVFDMPVEKPWLTFKRWADDYGENSNKASNICFIDAAITCRRRHTYTVAFPANYYHWVLTRCTWPLREAIKHLFRQAMGDYGWDVSVHSSCDPLLCWTWAKVLAPNGISQCFHTDPNGERSDAAFINTSTRES